MSITMPTALYQKSDETSQGVANFKTSVFKTNALSVPSLGQVTERALSAREKLQARKAPPAEEDGYEIDLSMRGVVRGGTRARGLTPPLGTVLAPFWLP